MRAQPVQRGAIELERVVEMRDAAIDIGRHDRRAQLHRWRARALIPHAADERHTIAHLGERRVEDDRPLIHLAIEAVERAAHAAQDRVAPLEHARTRDPVDDVILHGALASSSHLLLELEHLLAHFRVYSVDVVGQSVKSADARPSVSNNEYGEWLVEVVDQLKLERFALLGVSWGGFVATRFAVVAPSRITHLALLVPAGIVKGSAWAGLTKLAWPMTMYRMFPSEKRLAKFTRNLLTTPDDALWRPYLGDAFRSYNFGMRVPMLAKPEELANLAAPTFVVAADRDVSFPGSALLERARVLFPNCREELLENCLHSPPTTDEFRRSFGATLGAFFATGRTAQPSS